MPCVTVREDIHHSAGLEKCYFPWACNYIPISAQVYRSTVIDLLEREIFVEFSSNIVSSSMKEIIALETRNVCLTGHYMFSLWTSAQILGKTCHTSEFRRFTQMAPLTIYWRVYFSCCNLRAWTFIVFRKIPLK